jgi:predicted ATPase
LEKHRQTKPRKLVGRAINQKIMIENIKIEGYKSIKKLDLDLKPINILIGSNGVGKTNFVSFFKLVNTLFNERLQEFIITEGLDNLLYFGRKNTEILEGRLTFPNDDNSNNVYRFQLAPTNEGNLYIKKEGSGFSWNGKEENLKYNIDVNLKESGILKSAQNRDVYLRNHLENIQVFHFHDTSSSSYLRRKCDLSDNLYLKQDGRNLPAFLYLLKTKHPKIFGRILYQIQSVAPYIDTFILEPSRLNESEIELRWKDTGDAESNFSAYQLSDGTLRFIALTALLMQPSPPSTIIIDEPELGLHPFAINKLAAMIQVASKITQVIVSTQSPGLISHFEPEDIVVVDKSKSENQTIFKRLSTLELDTWLEEFTLGDLWERNILNAAQPFAKV